MSDIFREIEQEVRRDQALKLWSKYQIPIFILAALIVAATGAWRFYQNRQQQQSEAAGAGYETAIQLARDGKTADAQRALDEIGKGTGGYALLARFQAADTQAPKDSAGATKAYDAIAGDPQTPSLLKDLARLRAALLHVDDADPANVTQRLQALAAPGDPFHALAREQLAVLALKQKNYKEAGRWLDMIVSDPLAPAGARGRAESLMGLVASASPAPSPAPVPAPSAANAPSAAAGASAPVVTKSVPAAQGGAPSAVSSGASQASKTAESPSVERKTAQPAPALAPAPGSAGARP